MEVINFILELFVHTLKNTQKNTFFPFLNRFLFFAINLQVITVTLLNVAFRTKIPVH